jgi:hypothetical protein
MINFFNNIGKSVLSIIKLVFFTNWFGLLKHRTTKKTCMILGNGPSLLTSIEKYNKTGAKIDLFCVNNFACTEQYETLKPEYYILQAPQFFQEDDKLSSFYIEQRQTLFNHIKEKTNWDLFVVIPIKAKKSSAFNALLASNKHLKPLYFNDTAIEGFTFIKRFSFTKSLGMPRPHNVLIPSLINAINIGFTEIYIVGADHSWLGEISVNENNEALVHQKHFYDETSSKPEKMQDYIHRPRRLHEILNKFYLTFLGYWEIKEYAANKGVKIINASESSMIDAFERGSIESIK